MKNAVITMIVMFAIIVWPFGGIWHNLSAILGGSIQESYIYPLYGGIVLLSGIIVACTELVLKELKSIKESTED